MWNTKAIIHKFFDVNLASCTWIFFVVHKCAGSNKGRVHDIIYTVLRRSCLAVGSETITAFVKAYIANTCVLLNYPRGNLNFTLHISCAALFINYTTLL